MKISVWTSKSTMALIKVANISRGPIIRSSRARSASLLVGQHVLVAWRVLGHKEAKIRSNRSLQPTTNHKEITDSI